MKHPAPRRFHRAQAPAVRISGRSEPGTAPQPRIKSALTQKPACSLSTTTRSTISYREQKFHRRQNLFLGPKCNPVRRKENALAHDAPCDGPLPALPRRPSPTKKGRRELALGRIEASCLSSEPRRGHPSQSGS